jgi:hypothetical protein
MIDPKLSAEELTPLFNLIARWLHPDKAQKLFDHITALEAGNAALNLIGRGFEADAIAREYDVLTFKERAEGAEAELARIKGRLDEEGLGAFLDWNVLDEMTRGDIRELAKAIIAHVTGEK